MRGGWGTRVSRVREAAAYQEALVMRHFGKLMVAALGVLGLIATGSATALAHERQSLLQFDSMVGVNGAAVGTVNDRGITGGGLPWVIATGRGHVNRTVPRPVLVT